MKWWMGEAAMKWLKNATMWVDDMKNVLSDYKIELETADGFNNNHSIHGQQPAVTIKICHDAKIALE